MNKFGVRLQVVYWLSVMCIVIHLGLGSTVAHADEAAALGAFDEMNAFDIETARLAVKKGHSEAVRSLGQMIVGDHEPVRKEVKDMADRLGIKPAPLAKNAEYAKQAEELKKPSGTAFDQAYLTHELTFSKEFIRKLKQEILPAVTHDELKRYLQDLLPKFEVHLMHIEHTAMQLEMDSPGGQHQMSVHDKK